MYAAGYWPDRSIKWISVEFETFFKAHEKVVVTLRGGKSIRPAGDLFPELTGEGKKILISSGKLEALFDPAGEALLQDIRFDGKNFGSISGCKS